MKRKKTVMFSARISKDEYANLRKLSEDRELPMSIVFRQMLKREVEAPTNVEALSPDETKRSS